MTKAKARARAKARAVAKAAAPAKKTPKPEAKPQPNRFDTGSNSISKVAGDVNTGGSTGMRRGAARSR
ncbi:MAG: hypothetical protein ACTSY1_06490 [Alphaproteobacteria bacterium]